MSAAATKTLIPTGPHATLGGNGVSTPTPSGHVDPSMLALQTATNLLDKLADQAGKGKGGPVLTGLLAGLLGGLVASYAMLSQHGSGYEDLSTRVEQLERGQQWTAWALQSMAKAQGVELPPLPERKE